MALITMVITDDVHSLKLISIFPHTFTHVKDDPNFASNFTTFD
jgi:hypothetical protein